MVFLLQILLILDMEHLLVQIMVHHLRKLEAIMALLPTVQALVMEPHQAQTMVLLQAQIMERHHLIHMGHQLKAAQITVLPHQVPTRRTELQSIQDMALHLTTFYRATLGNKLSTLHV